MIAGDGEAARHCGIRREGDAAGAADWDSAPAAANNTAAPPTEVVVAATGLGGLSREQVVRETLPGEVLRRRSRTGKHLDPPGGGRAGRRQVAGESENFRGAKRIRQCSATQPGHRGRRARAGGRARTTPKERRSDRLGPLLVLTKIRVRTGGVRGNQPHRSNIRTLRISKISLLSQKCYVLILVLQVQGC